MKPYRPKSKAEANWNALFDLPHLVLGRAVDVLRSKPTWKRRLKAWGVVSIGYGRRAVGPDQVHLSELVLAFRVKKKWKRPPRPGSARAKQVIPKSVRLTLTIDGIRRAFEIPVDVQEDSVPRCAAQAQVVVTESHANGVMRGVPCALVRVANAVRPIYLLSCLHVFGGARWRPYTPLKPGLEVRENATHASLSNLVEPAYFAGKAAYDASIARLHAGGEQFATARSFWPTRLPTSIAVSDAQIEMLTRFDIYTPRDPAPVECRFVGVETQFAIRAPSGDIYHAARVIRAEFSDRTRATLPGDSGSPVMASSILAGMHIAGDDRYCYFIPAYALFYPKIAFDQDLELASDQIS